MTRTSSSCGSTPSTGCCSIRVGQAGCSSSTNRPTASSGVTRSRLRSARSGPAGRGRWTRSTRSSGAWTSSGMIHAAGRRGPLHRPASLGRRVLTAWLHVTNACNLRCPYCYVDKSAEGMDEADRRAAVEAVIRSAVAARLLRRQAQVRRRRGQPQSPPGREPAPYARELADRHGLQLHAMLLSNGVALPPAPGRGPDGRRHPGHDLARRDGRSARRPATVRQRQAVVSLASNARSDSCSTEAMRHTYRSPSRAAMRVASRTRCGSRSSGI